MSHDPRPLQNAPSEEVQRGQRERLLAAWRLPQGWRYWSNVNNSVVGVWYTALSFFFFLFGGVLALLMRVQLAVPDNKFLSADRYNQVFTLHGSVMMFLFAVPIFEAFSILILPQMLGTRELPFPRLSAYGFWCFLLGGAFLCGSLFFNVAPAGGWFMYPPLTTAYQPGLGADIWLLGFSFIEVAAIAAAVELIVAVLKTRPPGMRINLIPLYAWYMLVAAVMVLFAFPPLIAGSLLMELERAFQWPFFDAARGGDPLLWQHLFWIFGHPEVYIIFLPSIAIVAMIVPTFARTAMVGYGWVVLAAVGTGFLSFGLWVHHMFTTGLPAITLGFFSAASEAVAIPTGLQLFCFIATLAVGRVVSTVPMLFVYGGLSTFVMGGLTGVMLAIAPFNFQAHDTYFVVGHLHYVLIGGAIFPVLAGFYYFFPVAVGKRLSDHYGRKAFWLILAGFNLSFLPMHLTGLRGMPRRVYTYAPGLGFDTLNLISTAGALLLGAGVAIIAWDIVRTSLRREWSPRDPWSAGTLEWLTEMPGRPWGVRSIPEIDDRYPLWKQPNFLRDVDEGRFYLPDAEEGKLETLVTSVIDARPVQCLRVPGPSFIPLVAAVTSGGFFIFGTYHLWWPAGASALAAMAAILFWLWKGTAFVPEKPSKDVGLGVTLPLYASGPDSVGWWAMCITMLGDVTAFVSLVFGYFFYWSVHPDFPPKSGLGPLWPSLSVLLLTSAWAAVLFARRANRLDRAAWFQIAVAISIALAAGGAVALIAGPARAGLDPTRHVYPAIVWVLVAWTAVHVAVGIVTLLFCAAARRAGRMTARFDIDIQNAVLYWHFLLFMAVVTAAVIGGFPLVA